MDGGITGLLGQWRDGNRRALDQLLPLVYDELHGIAHRHMSGERANHTLQTTALLNEACAKLMGAEVDWADRTHFFAVASRVMRRILVDHARARRSGKRDGGKQVTLEDALHTAVDRPWDLLDVDLALQKLEKQDERKARIVELRFFGGLKYHEIGEAMGISQDSVDWDLRLARAWLRRELRGLHRGDES